MTNKEQRKDTWKRLGIVGGLGPETSCSFCLNINKRIKLILNRQPNIVIENLPVSDELKRRIVSGETPFEMKNLIKIAISNLNLVNVDFIVIPCNTVHVFLDELRTISKRPIISIIEECAKSVIHSKFKRVGILASQTTIKERLHQKELNDRGIRLIIPSSINQFKIDSIILNLLNNKIKKKDKNILLKIITELKNMGAEAIILGCTDLQSIISQKDSDILLLDTLSILEDFVIDKLSVEEK